MINSNDFSPKTKRWLAYAITGAICSDGVVSDSELDFLKQAIKFMDDKESIYEIIDLAKNKALPELSYLTAEDISKKQAIRIAFILGGIVTEDQKLKKGEKEFLKNALFKMSLSEEFYNGFIQYLEQSIKLSELKSTIEKVALTTGKGGNIE